MTSYTVTIPTIPARPDMDMERAIRAADLTANTVTLIVPRDEEDEEDLEAIYAKLFGNH